MANNNNDGYLHYEAGQAVAAVYLELLVRHVSGNPALAATDIVLPRNNPKARMILWLTGMAAEKKAVGKSSPLRRTRNRARMRAMVEAAMQELPGTQSKRAAEARLMLNQAQDRANAVCNNFYDAILKVAARLRDVETLGGETIKEIFANSEKRNYREDGAVKGVAQR